MHSDLPLQFLSLMKSHKEPLSFDDSLFIAKIPSLALSIANHGAENLATSLANLFEGYQPFSDFSRYCLAKRSGFSNHLEVVSSFEKDNSTNRMNPGYSCFVKPDSTLLKLKPTNIRIFNNISEVAQLFTAAGLTQQRSIKRLADAGFKSGICIPIAAKGHSWGYLFFNCHNDRLSKLSSLDFNIMAFIQAIVAQMIPQSLVCSDSYLRLGSTLQNLYAGSKPKEAEISSCMASHCQILHRNLETKVTFGSEINSLFSHGNLSNLLSRLADSYRWNTMRVKVIESKKGIEIVVRWGEGDQPSLDHFQSLPVFQDAKILGFAIHFEEGALHLLHKIDPIDSNSPVPYSTESDRF